MGAPARPRARPAPRRGSAAAPRCRGRSSPGSADSCVVGAAKEREGARERERKREGERER